MNESWYIQSASQYYYFTLLCTSGYVPLCFAETFRCKPVQPPLPQPIIVFHFSPTHCLSSSSDSEVTNTLKVPLARGKTVKQNYMLERSFIIVNAVSPK